MGKHTSLATGPSEAARPPRVMSASRTLCQDLLWKIRKIRFETKCLILAYASQRTHLSIRRQTGVPNVESRQP